MIRERLLERIAFTESDPQRREPTDHRRLTDSICVHLQRILNTRQGAVPIAPDYGVPDFLDFLQNFPDSVREIEQNMRQAIERYEPRLERVHVCFIPQDQDLLSLRFHIDAQVRDGRSTRLSFETMLETGGKITVQH
ncbi:type VI secretion system baseplate subunit TssE [Geomesophilobacter sediminis]|uniref:Type VI secretion system baseplate subunit TssE n=1 Tax=Geomesophilobacter sediminis TaxID=2798584 RepID=A0A8J7IN60_9BACT|nr:type VI secretion system baseplate subunit TssE [Geomesophilobacter sediminis]MBJ6724518.1 type VI secretion system baseplate subunit TssE [Geomesophilobacter sediminis]